MKNYVSSLEPESYWLKTGHRTTYPKLEDNTDTEIAIVGAGIGGILTAWHLINQGKNVALFERFRILNGTTGNTTSKLSAQHGLNYAKLIERYGEKTAKLYYEANMAGINEIKAIAKELNLEEFVEEENIYAYTTLPERVPSFKKEIEAYNKLGIDGEYLTESPLGYKVEASVVMYHQGIFHPVEFLNGVLAAAQKKGLKVYENTVVTEMERKSDNDILLKTKDGCEINCNQLVLTTHYPIFEKDAYYDMLMARTTHAMAYKTDKKLFDGAHIAYDTPSVTLRTMEYYGDHYLLIGGQSHMSGDGFSDEERYEKIDELAHKYFSVGKPVFKWLTHDLMSPDHIPLIGHLYPDYKNVYTITGLNAWGLANSSAGAVMICDMICGKENSYVLMYNPHREMKSIPSDKEKEKSSSKVSAINQIKVADLKPDQQTIIDHEGKRTGVYKDKNGKIYYYDLACTHMGCGLGLNDGDKTWDCPCHGSRFDKFGKVIFGPAIKDLPKVNISK